ncbi:MAG TPA: hypothetical protein VJP84_00600 [Steroidobacteraceae bacterium]|nr:hypothetical protein [Steroidobacteraceae bacterium]
MMARFMGALVVASLAAACVASGEDKRATPRAPPTRIPAPALNDQPAGLTVSTTAIPVSVRRAVVADAARRFKVPESNVVLTRAEQVTWPNGALGCPEPGTMYTQSLVPGFRVVAKTSSGVLLYHTDTQGDVRNCRVHEGVDPPQSLPDR